MGALGPDGRRQRLVKAGAVPQALAVDDVLPDGAAAGVRMPLINPIEALNALVFGTMYSRRYQTQCLTLSSKVSRRLNVMAFLLESANVLNY